MTGKYDFIIFGASGFTGQFVVEEAMRITEEEGGISFAIAGRNREKLESVLLKACENTGLNFTDIDIIIADVNDQTSLVYMAKITKLVINCVGPYRFHGIKVVEACLEGGADHIDISGEPQYLEQVQMAFSEEAERKGIHVVGSCGFDSVPADLGTVFLQNNFEGDVNSVEMIVGLDENSKSDAPIHATTLECALHGYASRKELGRIRKEIFKNKTPKSNYKPIQRGNLWWSKEANRWCLPNLASDRSVVMRTQNVNYYKLQPPRRPIYFNSAFFGIQSIFTVVRSILFAVIFSAMAPFEWSRNLFLKFPSLFSFGAFSKEGPKREELKDLKFSIIFIGRGWSSRLSSAHEQHLETPDVQKVAQVTGPDPGYFGTALIVIQCALTMVTEKNNLPLSGGVFTPGSAFLNTQLVNRLERKGIHFKMLS